MLKNCRKVKLHPNDIPEEDRDFYLERSYPSYGNLVPRDVASRAAKERCDAGFGVNAKGKLFISISNMPSIAWEKM